MSFFFDPVFALRTSNNGWYKYACIHAAEISNDELTPLQNVARLSDLLISRLSSILFKINRSRTILIRHFVMVEMACDISSEWMDTKTGLGLCLSV